MSAKQPRTVVPVAAVALRRPMAKVERVTLYEREVRERLSVPAVELLLDAAGILSEGDCVAAIGRGRPAFYGSTMLTIALEQAGDPFRELLDGSTARRLAALLAVDPRVMRRVRAIVEAESKRLSSHALGDLKLELRVRAEGTTLFIDVDYEGALPA